MTLAQISTIRLFSQKIEATEFQSVKDVVGWMGAMQAQDYAMSKRAVGLRLVHSTDEMVENAFNNGDIIRTHVMRPTLHFVLADDVYWMNDLSSAKIRKQFTSRHRELELSKEMILKSEKVFEKAISEEGNLTREELNVELKKIKIKTVENQLYHLLFCAELDGIICSGKVKDGKQTYDLLCKRVPNRRTLSRDESLAELAKRYFTSRCPATIEDFAWWSGLSITDARKGLEMIKTEISSETIDLKTFWFPISFSNYQSDKTSVHLLPAFDEFLISYKDRSATLSMLNNLKAVSSNGIFHPVVVLNGQVIGIWKRIVKKESMIIEVDIFHPVNSSVYKMIVEKAYEFGMYMNKKTDIKLNTK